jgi:hypothetical protein
MWWMFRATRVGLIMRVVGDSTDAARAMGLNVNLIRLLATAAGGAFAGVGGAYLSLFYPGSWNEGISSGQGLMAVALVIFARWNPIACFWAALPVRRGRGLGAGAAVGWRDEWLLSLLRSALRPDAGRADRHLLAGPRHGRALRRTQSSPNTEKRDERTGGPEQIGQRRCHGAGATGNCPWS